MRKRLFLIAAALVAFGWSLRGSFHFDDYSLAANPLINSTSGLLRMWRPLETRPLTNLTFWINYHLGGANPLGYHAVNLALHAAAVLLLYFSLRIILPETCAFWAALVFAIHPVQSEAVAYIFARSTLLSTVFCLGSLLLWLRGLGLGAIALFACALLSKEECVTFPLALLLLSPGTKPRNRVIAAMLGLAFFAGIRAAWATAHVAGSGAGFTAGVSPGNYLIAQGSAIFRYLRLIIFPWGLTVEPTVSHSNHLVYVLSWAAVFIVAGVALWAFRNRYAWGVWVIAGLILLLPSSSIFPAADLAADRRMYLPMTAFAAAFGVIQPWFWSQVPPVLAAALLALSIARTEVWRTEKSLWQEAAHLSPTHVRPLLQLSRVAPGPEAVLLLNEAKSIQPLNGEIAAELGRRWLLAGNYPLALQEFGKTLALSPNDANALNNRGAALLSLKQENAARLDFERALKINPCIEAARRNLRALTSNPLPPCPATEK